MKESEIFFKTAVRAAKEAGKLVMEYYNRLDASEVERKGQSDYVTKVDRLAEELIVGIVRKEFSDHSIQAEEGAGSQAGDGGPRAYHWLIDPLDGTTNYMHGFPMFCISIALAKDDELLLGIVYDPLRDELFWSRKGMGTWINRDQVRVSDEHRLEDALVATGFPFRHRAVFDVYLESFRRIFHRCGGLRRAGSAALDLAYVACARADGFWEYGLSPWDIAAGSLLVREAGGVMSDLLGGPGYLKSGHVVGGTPRIHEQLVGITREVFASLR